MGFQRPCDDLFLGADPQNALTLTMCDSERWSAWRQPGPSREVNMREDESSGERGIMVDEFSHLSPAPTVNGAVEFGEVFVMKWIDAYM